MRSASLWMTCAARCVGGFASAACGQQLGIAHHARQRLVELVGCRAGQLGDQRLLLADVELFLGLRELLLDPHALA